MNDLILIEKQIRNDFGCVVYTHKTHEKMADIYEKKSNYYKIAQISIAAIILASSISSFFLKNTTVKIIGIILSSISLYISTYVKNFDLDGLAQAHKNTAVELWVIRGSYFSLLTDIRSEKLTYDEAAKKRDHLQKKLGDIYTSSRRTNEKSYNQAKNALKNNEEYTFSDKEIDCFLPEILHSSNS